jgi:hypothetical protein
MKCLLGLVLASACGGAIPQPVAPIVEYPRGLRALDPAGPCSAIRPDHGIDHYITCNSIQRR